MLKINFLCFFYGVNTNFSQSKSTPKLFPEKQGMRERAFWMSEVTVRFSKGLKEVFLTLILGFDYFLIPFKTTKFILFKPVR